MKAEVKLFRETWQLLGGGVRRKKVRKHEMISSVHSMYWYEKDLIKHRTMYNEYIYEKQISGIAIKH